MGEPIRHSSSARNRRKVLHFAKNIRDELEHLHRQHIKRTTNINYMLGRIYKLLNRLKAESHRRGK